MIQEVHPYTKGEGGFIVKKYIILIITALIIGLSVFLLNQVTVNYDMKRYLPKNHELVAGIELHDELFGTSSYTFLILKNETLNESLAVKADLSDVDHISKIMFMDDILNELSWGMLLSQTDLQTQTTLSETLTTLMGQGLSFTEAFHTILTGLPVGMADELKANLSTYEAQGIYKMLIQFDLPSSSPEIEDVKNEMITQLDASDIDFTLVGGVMSDLFVRDAIEDEVLKITIVLIPLVLVILLMMTPSFADLLIFMVISGVAIIINLGTNAIFTDISFITQSMAIALQLAISLDYIIFIVHRYHKERLLKEKDEAMHKTMHHVTSPVIASAVTTGVSFLALVFMRFSIGMDIGLVFLKAVTLSALSSLILGPIMIKWLDRWMNKTKHKVFIPRFSAFSKLIYKLRYVLLAVFVLAIVPAYYFQSHNDFIYGESALIGSAGSSYDDDIRLLNETFGYEQQVVILTSQDAMKEAMLYQALLQEPDLKIKAIQSLTYYQVLITDPLVLAQLSPEFYQGNYQRMILTLNLEEESDEAFETMALLDELLDEQGFDEAYIISSTQAALSMKEVIEEDYFYVTLIALLLIMIVIFVTFKNWILPIILPLVIVTSVFLAMSIPYFFGYSLAFLGYLVVSTILLGATIDYAILFTKTYIDFRETNDVHLSIERAIEDSAPSIMTSALIFGIAGLSISLISSVLAIQQIGLQIALGAFFGLISVLVLLPQLIFIFNHWIKRSKVKIK